MRNEYAFAISAKDFRKLKKKFPHLYQELISLGGRMTFSELEDLSKTDAWYLFDGVFEGDLQPLAIAIKSEITEYDLANVFWDTRTSFHYVGKRSPFDLGIGGSKEGDWLHVDIDYDYHGKRIITDLAGVLL